MTLLICIVPVGTASAQKADESRIEATGNVSEEARKRLQAVRTSSPPSVDGDLSDRAWSSAEVATNFVQFRPEHGAEPSQRTEVRVLYTEDAVYVGARMFDTAPESIVARLSRRDAPVTADRFQVGFDSYYNNRTGFVFGVTAAGVQTDALLYEDTNEDQNWDAVWASAARIDSAGWTAELRIPLSQLRFSAPGDTARGDTWGVNFQREIARLDETVQWSPFPEDRSRMVSAFGRLTGLRNLSQPKNLEIRPYTVARATRAPVDVDNPFRDATDVAGSVGGSLTYGITPNLTLNATVNPDFGQVEADPSVVNLSAFETFFPEKRPFFTEGTDIFQYGVGLSLGSNEKLFYSRRIGRAPRGSAPASARFSESPNATTILGAAKLSGKTSDGWSLGLLNALTAEESARYLEPGSGPQSTPIEPMTNYSVFRAKKNFRGGESTVGGILTSTIRDVEAGGPMGHLASGAWTGGLDTRHRFADGDWELTAKLLGSHLTGSAAAMDRLQQSPNHFYQRPDADHLTYDSTRTALTGASAKLNLLKVGGHWRGGIQSQTRTPGFEVNDLGFQQGADRAGGIAWVGYRSLGPSGPFRDWNLNVNGWNEVTWGGERIMTGGNMNGWFQLKNYWRGHGGVGYNAPALSTTELRGGPAIRQQPGLNGWTGLSTDSRRAIQFGLSGNWGKEFGTEGGRISLGPSVTLQPSNAVQLSLRPSMTWNRSVSQYVTTADGSDGGTHYVTGDLRQRTASLTTRLQYIFSPHLSLQLYAQPFISAGDYTRFWEVADPRAASFENRFRRLTDSQLSSEDGRYRVDRDGDGSSEYAFRDPNFNIRQLRSNVVLRWEYMPGSRLYLVWSQDRSGFAPYGRFRLGRDLDGLFGAPGRNVFLLKVEHWLGL